MLQALLFRRRATTSPLVKLAAKRIGFRCSSLPYLVLESIPYAMAAEAGHMFKIDKAAFNKSVVVTALRVPVQSTEAYVKGLRDILAEFPRVRPVQIKAGDDKHRYLLLRDDTGSSSGAGVVSPAIQARIRDVFSRFPYSSACCETSDSEYCAGAGQVGGGQVAAHLLPWELSLGYDNLTPDQVLRALLPPALTEIPSAFEAAGHVAHVNLKDEALPYKYIVGAVLLDKNPTIRTVVNKTASIESRFRTFPMEVLAGDGDTKVQLRHCGATFRFDFRQVYWNSRLQQEHQHMVSNVIRPGSVVADVFCGVGPFAIPLAHSKSCVVHANDLNPVSALALKENVARNHVEGAVTCYNMDGRAFIMHMAASRVPIESALMNLPADALAFLDAFVGFNRHTVRPEREGVAAFGVLAPPAAAAEGGGAAQTFSSRPLPIVHCYCFSKAETDSGAADDVTERALTILRLPVPSAQKNAEAAAAAEAPSCQPCTTGAGGSGGLDSPLVRASRVIKGLLPDLTVRVVRDVAPRKLMLCVSFTLPAHVADAEPVVTWDALETSLQAEDIAEKARAQVPEVNAEVAAQARAGNRRALGGSAVREQTTASKRPRIE